MLQREYPQVVIPPESKHERLSVGKEIFMNLPARIPIIREDFDQIYRK